MKFPVFSQLAGNSDVRDEFAPDCFLQRRVCVSHSPDRGQLENRGFGAGVRHSVGGAVGRDAPADQYRAKE